MAPVRVIATVDASGTGSYLRRLAGPAGAHRPTAGSPYRIELLDAAGALIASAVPATTSIEVEQAPSSTLLDATLPNSPAAPPRSPSPSAASRSRTAIAASMRPPSGYSPPPGCEARPCQGNPDPLARTRRRQRSAARDRELFRRPRPSLESHRRSAHRQPVTSPAGRSAPARAANPRHGQRRLQPHDRNRRTPAGTRRPTAGPDHPSRAKLDAQDGTALLLQGTAFDDAGDPLTGSHLRWYANQRPIGRGALLTVPAPAPRSHHHHPDGHRRPRPHGHRNPANEMLAPNPVLTQSPSPHHGAAHRPANADHDRIQRRRRLHDRRRPPPPDKQASHPHDRNPPWPNHAPASIHPEIDRRASPTEHTSCRVDLTPRTCRRAACRPQRTTARAPNLTISIWRRSPASARRRRRRWRGWRSGPPGVG